MKRFLIFALASLLPVAAFAQAAQKVTVHNGEIDLGGSYQSADKHGARSGSLTVSALAPLAGRFYIGPEVRGKYQDSELGFGIGPIFEFNFGKGHLQPFLLADGVRWITRPGEPVRWQAGLGGGLKIGLDRAYVRLAIARQRAAGASESTDSTAFTVGVGYRL